MTADLTGQGIQPAPMPTGWQFAQVQVLAQLPDGGTRPETHVLMVLSRPSGNDYYFFPPQAAKVLAAQLEQQASLAATGIVVADRLPPPPANGRGPTIIGPPP